MHKPKLPGQNQLLFPLLEFMQERGGESTPREAADALAERLKLPAEVRRERVHRGRAGYINLWDRHVRWVSHRAKQQGWMEGPEKNLWALTEEGKNTLRNCKPGVVVTVYETDWGSALWAEAESAMGFMKSDVFNLILTSPPYPLLKQKEYGNRKGNEYIDWILSCAAQWKELLAEDGSLILNLGDVYNPGLPTINTYQERLVIRLEDELGLHLAQKLYWENTSKLPSPAEWVTVRRVRVTNSVEQIYWLSKTPHPKANNRHVLRPYSEAMQKRLRSGGDKAVRRPSGHHLSQDAFRQDNGGSIAHNVLLHPNTASNDVYQRRCKAAGIKPHPARFPAALPEFFIRMTTDPGDWVYDPFGGSGQTAEVCERLGRHWVISEKSLTYLQGSTFRFLDRPGFRHRYDELKPLLEIPDFLRVA